MSNCYMSRYVQMQEDICWNEQREADAQAAQAKKLRQVYATLGQCVVCQEIHPIDTNSRCVDCAPRTEVEP